MDTDLSQWGVQWLGSAGGTGDRRQAAVIPVRRGQTVTAPVIKLDRPGSISAMITDRATGAPVTSGTVMPFGLTTGLWVECSNLPAITYCTGR